MDKKLLDNPHSNFHLWTDDVASADFITRHCKYAQS